MPAIPDGGGADRERRALDLYARAFEMPPAERERFFDRECEGDPALRADVDSLSRADDDGLDLRSVIGVDPRAIVSGAFGIAAGPLRGLPSRIGPYRVIRAIGEGGMGLVLEAEQENPRRRVAIKVLSRLAASPRAQRRFEREAEVMARLEHEAIARVLDAGRFETELGHQPFLVMELVDGVPLTTFARERGLPVRDRVALVAEIAEGIEHAHAMGVVHRDLKPANILVTKAGRPKILDFGVARADDLVSDLTAPLTGTGQMMGTLAYMSPEQISGSGPADAQSDVYALGVILYELLTGRSPHELDGLPLVEAARVLRDEDPTTPSRWAPELRGDLDAIILTALAKDRRRRHPTAAALAADLRRNLAGEKVLARTEGFASRTLRLIRRNRGLATAIGAVIASLVLGLLAVSWQAARATRLAREERRRAYVADVHAAAAALETADPGRLRAHLSSAPSEERDWEWRWLSAHSDGSRAVMRHPEIVERISFGPGASSVLAAGGASWSSGALDGAAFAARRAEGWLKAVEADASGRALGLACGESEIALVDLDTGRVSARLSLPELGLFHGQTDLADISADGALVAASMQPRPRSAETRIITWVPGGAHELRFTFAHGESQGEGPTSLALSDDGALLVVGTQRGFVTWARLDAPGAPVLRASASRQPIRSIAIDASGTRILAGGQDNSATILDASTGEILRVLPDHRGPVHGVAWSADGRIAVTASGDHVVRAWDGGSGQVLAALLGHVAGVHAVAVSKDGAWLASGDERGELRTWRMPTATPRGLLSGHSSFVYPVAWSPDGARLYSGSWDGTVRAWDPAREVALGEPWEMGSPVVALAASPDGMHLAAGLGDGRVVLMDPAARTTRALASHGWHAGGIAFSADSQRLVTAGWDEAIRLWSVSDGAMLAETSLPRECHYQSLPLAFSPDGRVIASFAPRTSLRLLDAATLAELARLDGHRLAIAGLAFSGDGTLLASASEDGTARTWDVARREPVSTLAGHRGTVHSVAFSADGRRIATGSKDGTVRLWDPVQGDDLLVLQGHRDYVFSVAFSPDGERIASGSGDGTVRIWSTRP